MMMLEYDLGEYEWFMKMIEFIILIFYDMKKIVIVVIYGVVVGFGLSFVLCVDVVFVEENVCFVMNFIGIGLVFDGGGYYLLMRCVGEIEVKKLIWSGEKLLVEKVVWFKFVDGLFSGDFVVGVKLYID